ncbi:cell division protein FtsB [Chitinibacter bivalviorum]|uniref:Cell division protein FtsB n=1 Tax=Chitinibacter bivalviorum TaxID=2739434 RepID=A0A7H9BFJ5_9NEIS|nr:cell division protein FtsB [Chitinibacter bivalviorum]QLG87480.1 cell division protein FtsB [Chitinibacter bivalviorum]
MRILALVFAVLIIALQWPLWIGKGSWMRVWQLDTQLAQRQSENAKLKERNTALEAEVNDLKNGTDAIEERARNELGMIRSEEVFFQVLDRNATKLPEIKASNSSAVTAVTNP